MLGAVVPLMRPGNAFVVEIFADWIPGFAAIVRALDQLPKPTARLRGVDAVRINRRTFEMINFPTGKVRATDFPVVALAVGGENKRAFARADE